MRKSINYELPYFEAGEEKKKTICIKFVSNRVYDTYSDIAQRFNELQGLISQRTKLVEDLAFTSIDKNRKLLERVKAAKPIKQQLATVEKQIQNIDAKGFLQERFELITRILTDNGVKDQQLLSYDFWDTQVEPKEVWGLLTAAVTKDTTGKKKAKR